MRWLERLKSWGRRQILAAIGYEGATHGRRGGWGNNSSAADDLIRPSIDTLRNRSRDLVRNHWAGKRAMLVLGAHIIGTGILPSCRSNDTFHKLLQDWAKPQTQVGAHKGESLVSIQLQTLRSIVEGGSAIVLREWVSRETMRARGMELPFTMKVLEPEYLDRRKDGLQSDGNVIIHGVEYQPDGWPVAYHLYTRHPRSTLYGWRYESVRVPASDVSYPFWRERPGQTIGVPWLTPILIKLKDYDKYEDAQLVRQQVAAMFAGFVTNEFESPSPQKPDTDPMDLVPGRIQFMEVGQTVEFADPPEVTGYRDFATINLRSVAVALGLSYEDLSGDYSQVNFSSARMGALVSNELVDQWRAFMMIGQFCSDAERWIAEAAPLVGVQPEDCQWTPPRRALIDPSREVGAIIRKIDSGLSSRQDEVRKLGRHVEDVDEERRQDMEREEELGIADLEGASNSVELSPEFRQALDDYFDQRGSGRMHVH